VGSIASSQCVARNHATVVVPQRFGMERDALSGSWVSPDRLAELNRMARLFGDKIKNPELWVQEESCAGVTV
jgi:hypothetical protein